MRRALELTVCIKESLTVDGAHSQQQAGSDGVQAGASAGERGRGREGVVYMIAHDDMQLILRLLVPSLLSSISTVVGCPYPPRRPHG